MMDDTPDAVEKNDPTAVTPTPATETETEEIPRRRADGLVAANAQVSARQSDIPN